MPQCEVRDDSKQSPEQILQRTAHLRLVDGNDFVSVERIAAELGGVGERSRRNATFQCFHGVEDVDIDLPQSLQQRYQPPLFSYMRGEIVW